MYGTILGCLANNGVIGCGQPKMLIHRYWVGNQTQLWLNLLHM
jgi:hypothetical protein